MDEKEKQPCVACGQLSEGLAGFDGWTEEMGVPCCEGCHRAGKFHAWAEESIKMLQGAAIRFPSLGNLLKDRRELERALLSQERMDDGICPNGCAIMVRYEEGDNHTRQCPVCKFVGWQNTPIEFPYEK